MLLRWFIFGLCFFFCLFSKAQGDVRINSSFSETTLGEALVSLEKNYGLNFAYENTLIAEKQVSVRLKNIPLKHALKKLLAPHDISYRIIDQKFIVLTKNKNVIDNEEPESKEYLRGKIVDQVSGEELPYAGVFFKHNNRGVYADTQGKFSLIGPFSRNDTLVIRYLGYAPLYKPISELQGKKDLHIALQRDIQTLENIEIVKTAMQPVDFLPQSQAFSFRPEKIGTLPGWGEPDIFRALQLLPGISSTDESANLHVRGGTPDQNLILWDGIPVYHNAHFFGMFSAVNPYIIDSAEIYRGGFGANYGGRVSSVLDIKSKPNGIDQFRGSVHLNLLSLEGNFEFPAKKIKSEFLFSFRRAYSDIIQSSFYEKLFDKVFQQGLIFDDRQQQQNDAEELALIPTFRYYDLNAKWNFLPHPNTKISLSVYAGQDILDYSKSEVYEDEPPDFSINNLLDDGSSGFSLNWQQKWKPNFSTQVQLITSNFQHNYEFNALGREDSIVYARYLQLNSLEESILRITGKWKLNEKITASAGWSTSTTRVSIRFYGEEDNEVDHDETYDLESDVNVAFFRLRNQHASSFSSDLGIRMSRYTLTGDSFISPRLTLHWQAAKRLNLTAHLGHYVQFASHMVEPNPLEVSDLTWILSNGNEFQPVTSTQASIGANYTNGSFFVGADVYLKSLHGLTTSSLQFNRGQNDFSSGEGEVAGLDVFMSKKWGNYTTWWSYTMASVWYQFDDVNEAFPFPASFDQRHSMKWTHLWNKGPWHVSASFHLGSGRPFTVGQIEEYINDEGELEAFLYTEGRNDFRLPTYHRLDLAFSKDFSIGKEPWRKGKVGISVFNAYNRRNLQDIRYLVLPPEPEDGINSHRLVETQRQLLGITPNVFLHLAW